MSTGAFPRLRLNARGSDSVKSARMPNARLLTEPWLALTASAALLLAGCAGGGNQEGEPTSPEIESPAGREPPPELAEACEQYEAANNEWMTGAGAPSDDQRFAARLEEIADGAGVGTVMEAPLDEMAAEFRAGQLSIDAGVISDLCSGNTPVEPSPEETEMRTAFLQQVRSTAPALSGIADDDLVAAAEPVCDGVESVQSRGENDRQRYFILTNIAGTAIGHDNDDDTPPVIRAAVDVFCPQHATVVDAILAAG